MCVWVGACRLALDLQDGGVMVQNGQNDFVHVLPQAQVDLLLLLQSVDQLRVIEREREERERHEMRWAVTSNVNNTPVHQQQTDLVSGGIVNLSCQALSLGLAGKQALRFIQAQAENLSVQVVVLIPQLMVLLRRQKDNRFFQRKFRMKLSTFYSGLFKLLLASRRTFYNRICEHDATLKKMTFFWSLPFFLTVRLIPLLFLYSKCKLQELVS